MAAVKKGANALTYKVKVFNDTGIIERRCTIISRDDHTTTIRYKKPRSSVFAYRPIPTSSIISIESGTDKGTLIRYRSRQQIAEYKGIVEADPKSNMLKITTEDGRTVFVHPGSIDAEADDRSDNPANGDGKKKVVKKKTAK